MSTLEEKRERRFKEQVSKFRENLKGKTVIVHGERWLFEGTLSHRDNLYMTFVVPSRAKTSKSADYRDHRPVGEVCDWFERSQRDENYPIRVVPIEPKDQELLEELLS